MQSYGYLYSFRVHHIGVQLRKYGWFLSFLKVIWQLGSFLLAQLDLLSLHVILVAWQWFEFNRQDSMFSEKLKGGPFIPPKFIGNGRLAGCVAG